MVIGRRIGSKKVFSEKAMNKKPEEWLKQADYDIKTADFLFNGRKYIYTEFMCHLAKEKDKLSKEKSLIPMERIERSILLIRGQRVMLDADLAALYGVETIQLTRAVKRNLDRFPSDFMFQLNEEEFENLRFHFGTSSQWGKNPMSPMAP